MNTEPTINPKKPGEQEKPSFREALHALPRRLWRLLLHNLPWKLLALVLAVALWAGLITQDPTLTRERTFTDVPVTITGEDTLRRNGMIVLSGLEEETLAVRLRADVPQREYTTVAASNYNPRLDLSRITETGPQTLRILTSSSTTYGTVKELSPDSVDVVVDAYITNYRVPVSVERQGEFPKGYYGTAPTLDPSTVSISGPKSIVDRIARVTVDFDTSQLPAQAGTMRTAVPIRFTGEGGEVIESDLLEVTSAGVLLKTIVVNQTLYPTKTLPISSLSLTKGTPAAGYEVRSVTATPSILVAAGDEIGLEALDTLFLEQEVDVTDRDASFTAEVKVRKPSELVYISTESVTLSIEIAPIIGVREFEGLPLSFVDNTERRQADAELKTVSLTLTGPAMYLDSLSASNLTAYVDISDLPEGEQEAAILLKINSPEEKKFTYDITPKTLLLNITME